MASHLAFLWNRDLRPIRFRRPSPYEPTLTSRSGNLTPALNIQIKPQRETNVGVTQA